MKEQKDGRRFDESLDLQNGVSISGGWSLIKIASRMKRSEF